MAGIFRPLLPSTGAAVLFMRMATPKVSRRIAAAKPAWAAGRAKRRGRRDSIVAGGLGSAGEGDLQDDREGKMGVVEIAASRF